MLFRSLRLRILVMFALVLMVAIGTVAFTAQQVTTRSFVQYAGSVNQQEQITLSKVLTIYRTNAGPAAVQRAVDQLAAADGRRIIFIGPDKRVIADSAHQLIGQVLSCTPPPPSPPSCLGPLSSKSAMEHVLILNTMPPDGVLFASTTGSTAPGTVKVRVRSTLSPAFNGVGYFVSSISRSLILAAILGGLLAFLLTLFLAARILRPVQALTKAAREMARGDLTQRVPVDGYDELAVLAGAFNVMADSVARAERLRRTMLGDVAHDLRTPLTSISGYLEAIEDGLVRPTPPVITALRGDVALLKRLIEDLQELAQAEAGQLKFDCRPLDVFPVLQQAVAVLLPQAQAKGVHIELVVPETLPAVLADAQRVGQVVRNLLQNAITATPPGGRVTLNALGGDPLEVSVADTGIGIPPEHLPNVFERFYRVDPARNRATGGSGLGLAIVKQLVEQQGGQVAAESIVGTGSVFRFTLPLAPVSVTVREPLLA